VGGGERAIGGCCPTRSTHGVNDAPVAHPQVLAHELAAQEDAAVGELDHAPLPARVEREALPRNALRSAASPAAEGGRRVVERRRRRGGHRRRRQGGYHGPRRRAPAPATAATARDLREQTHLSMDLRKSGSSAQNPSTVRLGALAQAHTLSAGS
jgi:hypothetical protein